MSEEARICPGGGHVPRVMRHRGQTDSQMATLPVSDADISIQPPATPRPLLTSMVTKYLDGGFLEAVPSLSIRPHYFQTKLANKYGS